MLGFLTAFFFGGSFGFMLAQHHNISSWQFWAIILPWCLTGAILLALLENKYKHSH